MGRRKLKDGEHKVKFGICVSPELFDLLQKEEISRSKFIEKVLKEYYGNKKMF